MNAALPIIAGVILAVVTLVCSIVFGIRHWTELRGKIIAVGSGLALVGIIAGVAFIALMATILPEVIALP